MTTLERINELREEHLKYKNNRAYVGLTSEYTELLFKAFKVMREIALDEQGIDYINDDIDEEFEERMK